jgi:TP901 family phage tail tape measure protein
MSAGAIRAGRTVIEIGADPKAYLAALDRLRTHIRNVGVQINNAGVAMVGLGTAATAPFVGALRQSASFQATMAAVAAVTDATGADFDALRKKALDLGSSTSFSAQQVADGMQALGQGGFTVQETLSGIDGALLLARAGMLELGDATSITVSVLRSFAMPTQQAAKVADVLAKAANSSNASVEGLGAGLSIVSGIAHTAGASLEETSAALGVLADRGADASVAGTAIRRIFMGLATEQKKLSALGVEVKDPQTGKLKPLIQVFKDLKAATANMDASQRIAKLVDIFDAFGANAAGQLIDATDSLEALTRTLGDSEGAARKAAGIMDDTLGGSMRLLMSAVEGVAIGVGDALTPAVREWATYLSRLTAGIGQAIGRNGELVVQIAKLAAGSIGAGVALLTVGTSIRVVAFALGGLSTAAKVALAPLTMTTRTALLLGTTLTRVAGMVGGFSASSIGGVLSFSTRSGVALARATSGFGQLAVASIESGARVSASMAGTALSGVLRFTQQGTAALAQYTAKSTALVAVSAAQAGSVGASQVAATVSVISATVARAAEGNMRAAAIGVQAFRRLGVAGTTNALIVGAQMSRLSVQGGTQLIRLGHSGSTALATIGTTSLTVGQRVAVIGTSAVKASATMVTSVARATATGVVSAATLSAAWVANLARITTAAAINGVAIAASFLAPFAGVAAVAGLAAVGIAGVAVAVGRVGGQSGPLFERMSAGFQAIAAQAQKAFGHAFSIASTTVSGISDAITAGELSIAFDVLWAGLASAWASGQQGVMGMVDSFTEYVQNAWGNMQTYLIDSLMGSTTSMEGMWGNFTGFLYDIWTGGVDKIVEYWNAIVNPIKRVIDTIRSYFDGSMDYEEVARQAKAANEAAKAGRSQRTQDRAGQRNQSAADAQEKLGKVRMQASGAKEAAELVVRATQAATGDELRAIEDRGRELQAEGNITKEQYDRLSGAVDDQALEIDRARALQSQEQERMAQAQDMVAGAGGAVEQQTAKIDSAGTFNAAAIQGMGFSSNLAERTAKAAEETAKNTRNMSAEVQS